MARLIREKDWSRTPFGPTEAWPTALRAAVGICLGSRFPMVLYWGEGRALIYNDAWSLLAGQRHPWALGRPAREVWTEIWPIIGPMFDHVMATGEATWSHDQLLPLNRFGYLEECYFYYSYSPVRGDGGVVEGIFTAVTETTYRVLAERRERLLREISEATSNARSPTEACTAALGRAAALPQEAPFLLAYLHEPGGGLRLAARVGAVPAAQAPDTVPAEALGSPPVEGHETAPTAAVEVAAGDLAAAATETRPAAAAHLTDGAAPWPFRQAHGRAGPVAVNNLASRPGAALWGSPWPEPIEQALVVPIPSASQAAPFGYLVAGLSPRRRLDASYATLFGRIAAHIATAIGNAEAHEHERRRAEQLAELDRAETTFFSNASHEFRTPLTLMLAPIEEMLDASAGSAQVTVEREQLALVRRNGQRLLRLVNTLLDFSRIEAGRVRAAFEPVDLAVLTRDLASTFRSALERAGLRLTIDCPPLPEPVWVDREMWEKVVLNLLSNALKYTLEGSVTVSLSATAAGAVLRVSDTGVGIAPDELPRVFDRFHRIEGQGGAHSRARGSAWRWSRTWSHCTAVAWRPRARSAPARRSPSRCRSVRSARLQPCLPVVAMAARRQPRPRPSSPRYCGGCPTLPPGTKPLRPSTLPPTTLPPVAPLGRATLRPATLRLPTLWRPLPASPARRDRSGRRARRSSWSTTMPTCEPMSSAC